MPSPYATRTALSATSTASSSRCESPAGPSSWEPTSKTCCTARVRALDGSPDALFRRRRRENTLMLKLPDGSFIPVRVRAVELGEGGQGDAPGHRYVVAIRSLEEQYAHDRKTQRLLSGSGGQQASLGHLVGHHVHRGLQRYGHAARHGAQPHDRDARRDGRHHVLRRRRRL